MTEQMIDDDEYKSEKFNLNVGQKFNDYEQLSMSVNIFCREYYHPFVTRTRSQKQVLYKCCHGIKQISKCKGKHPNFYKSSLVQTNFYKVKSEKWTLTKMLLDHNHKIGKEEYGNYGKGKKSEIDFDAGNCFKVNIRDHVEDDEIFANDYSCHKKFLSDKEQFNMALGITKNIADILSDYETETFGKYLEVLKVIESNARNGVCLFKHEGCAFESKEPEEQILSHKEFSSSRSVKNLKFKTKIISKGLPERKTKETTFFKKQIKI